MKPEDIIIGLPVYYYPDCREERCNPVETFITSTAYQDIRGLWWCDLENQRKPVPIQDIEERIINL